jgi:hypothetical protein
MQLPVPPIPPDMAPAYSAAPIPDNDARGPAEAESSSVRLAPSLYRHEKTFNPGQGYTPGSSFKQNEQERLAKPMPGVDVRVPLP